MQTISPEEYAERIVAELVSLRFAERNAGYHPAIMESYLKLWLEFGWMRGMQPERVAILADSQFPVYINSMFN